MRGVRYETAVRHHPTKVCVGPCVYVEDLEAETSLEEECEDRADHSRLATAHQHLLYKALASAGRRKELADERHLHTCSARCAGTLWNPPLRPTWNPPLRLTAIKRPSALATSAVLGSLSPPNLL